MRGITRLTDYATRVVLHLATLEPGARVPIAEVTAQRLMPTPFVRRVLTRLTAAGILVTSRGKGGGVRLARPPAEISLLDVVRAVEGGICLNRCVDDPLECPLTATCPVHRAWVQATRTLEALLAEVRFDRLAEELRSSPPGG